MAKQRNPIVMWCTTTATLAVFRFLRALPLPVARALSKRASLLGYHLVPRIKRIGLRNLDLAYKDELTAAEKRRILKKSMENLGIVVAEMAHSDILSTPEGQSMFTVKGLEQIEDGKGVLFIGAHIGNWEWMCGIFGNLGRPAAGVVRPLADPRLNDFIDRSRRLHGVDTIAKYDAGGAIIKAVREGKVVGILIDQATRKNCVPVTFFGEACWATIGPVMMAIRTKVPIHPISITRDTTGHYTFEIHEQIHLERQGSIHEDMVRLTQQCQDVIEEIVRAYPDQWMWIHDRWKRYKRPEKEWAERGFVMDWPEDTSFVEDRNKETKTA